MRLGLLTFYFSSPKDSQKFLSSSNLDSIEILDLINLSLLLSVAKLAQAQGYWQQSEKKVQGHVYYAQYWVWQ